MAKNTRFMEVLFSATEERDEELTNQVANDIEDAAANGEVDTEEVNYKSNGDGSVSITDKENGEVTIAEKGEDGQYDLYPAQVTEVLEGYLHPERDGVTPGAQEGVPAEHVEDHEGLENGVSASNLPIYEVEDLAIEGPEGEVEEQVEFSVSSDNSVVLKIFSDQEFCERLFSEVIESEETAKVGDLKIEKLPDEECSVIVTDLSSGDQAKVSLEDDEMEVEELDSKNFSDECECDDDECECGEGINEEVELGDEQYLPLHVVGVDTFNHQIVDAVEYDEDSANELVEDLEEAGVDGVQIFPDPDSARDYAIDLLNNLGVEDDSQVDEPEQVEFSDYSNVYVTRFYSNSSDFMLRMFSEAANDIDASQSVIEDALENGDEIETDTEIITPIDAVTAVVEDKDNGEYTKVTISDDDMDLSPLTEDEADDLMEDIAVSEDEVDEDSDEDEDDDEEEKDFSDIWTNEEETKFFSENEYMTDYMIRLFSEEADEEEIEDAIESGEQIETDDEVITPVDATTAVIEDKDSGEFTKAVLSDDDIDLSPIDEEEADELMDGLEVEDSDEDEDDDEEEKDFSDIWTNEEETRFFSEDEVMTEYMERIFSEEADQDEVEDAIESGEQIETDDEVITPVDATTAVIEDKETGEFTKATILDDEDMEFEAIEEDEADELTDGLALEEDENTENQKHFSDNPMLCKFFNEMYDQQAAQAEQSQQNSQAQGMNPNAAPQQEEKPSIEQVEDKAQAAIQAIQEMTQQAQAAIQEAKEAPVEGQEEDLREATFSETGSIIDSNNTALSWLEGNMR